MPKQIACDICGVVDDLCTDGFIEGSRIQLMNQCAEPEYTLELCSECTLLLGRAHKNLGSVIDRQYGVVDGDPAEYLSNLNDQRLDAQNEAIKNG